MKPDAAPDLILRRGKFTTLDPANRTASAVAIQGGRFIHVADDARVMALPARLLAVALTRSRGRLRYSAMLEAVVRMHYNQSMKTAVIPQVRVEPELRADLDSVLLPGETLTEFVETSVRRAVEFRRVQTDFAARCDASLAAYERTGTSIPSDLVLSKLEAKVAARVKQLRK